MSGISTHVDVCDYSFLYQKNTQVAAEPANLANVSVTVPKVEDVPTPSIDDLGECDVPLFAAGEKKVTPDNPPIEIEDDPVPLYVQPVEKEATKATELTPIEEPIEEETVPLFAEGNIEGSTTVRKKNKKNRK